MNPPRLHSHRHALETCVYCPKLCRAACPVSNAEGSETLTPWGKMSLAYFLHRGDVARDAEHAEAVWACTGCLACRQRCEHRNEVAHVLREARAELWAASVDPSPARALRSRWPDHLRAVRAAAAALAADEPHGRTALLLGCALLRHCPDEARATARLARWLVPGEIRIVRGCCGLPLREAGDWEGFERQARQLCEELAGADRVLVVDPGCARTLLEEYPRLGVQPGAVELLADRLVADIDRIPERSLEGRALRLHDSCQLARALGRASVPRRVLERLTGVAPAEFVRCRQQTECCGAGGLLPLTRPETSRAIALERIEEHHGSGGGTLVTTCGGSLHRFRTAGEPAEDWLTLVAHALRLVEPAQHRGTERG